MHFKLPQDVADKLRASVEQHGGIGITAMRRAGNTPTNAGPTPCCVFGHAEAIDGLFGPVAKTLLSHGYGALLLDTILKRKGVHPGDLLSFDQWLELTETVIIPVRAA